MKNTGVSLRFRIWLLIGALVAVAVLTGYTGLRTSRVFTSEFEPLKNRELVAADLLWLASINAYYVNRAALEIAYLRAAGEADGLTLERQRQALSTAQAAAQAHVAEVWRFVESYPETAPVARTLENDQRRLSELAEALGRVASDYLPVADQARMKRELEAAYDELQDRLWTVGATNHDIIFGRLGRVAAAGSVLRWAMIALAVLGLCVLAAAAVVLGRYERSVARPILALQQAAAAMQGGDLTARAPVNGEADLARLSRTFNALAAHLQAELAERERSKSELSKARDQALETSRHKSEFLANMSHEVRTPLSGVIGMATLLLDTDLDDQQREQVEVVVRSAKGLLQVLNDVLDLSKIEAGRLELDPQPFDLEVLAREVTELLAAAAETKGLRLVLRIAPDTTRHLVGDSLRLQQVLTNLLGNAVKFTDSGHVLLDIEEVTDPAAAAGRRTRVRFSVEDTGIGIPNERLAGIFDAFAQADASTTRRHGGSGLGLTISRQLVRLLGSELEVTSAVGRGSRFWFEVELDRSEQAASTGFDPGIRGARVLLVDDVPLHRRVLIEQLQGWHLAVSSATDESSAREAVRHARHAGDPFRLAIVNHRGGALDGAALAVLFSEDAGSDPAPNVILLTPIAPCAGAELLHEGRIATCLPRPVTPSELLDSLTAAWLVGFTARLERESRPTPTAAASTPPLAGGPLSVLVAEDNEINRRVAVRHLQKLGCRVETVTNGADAVQRIQEQPFDLVLMDCQMPELDGFEATARIRALAGPAATTPIVALTAHAMRGDRERCLAAGMSDYLPKPLDPAALAEVVRRYAHGSTAVTPATAPRAFDHERLLEAVDRDQELLCELVSLVNSHAPSVLDAIAAAVRAGRGPDVAAKAHELRGMLLNVHAASAAEWARRLELAADTGRSHEWPALLAGVREETERVVGEADRFLAEADLEPKDPPLRQASAG